MSIEAKQVEEFVVPIQQLDELFFRPGLYDDRFASSEHHT